MCFVGLPVSWRLRRKQPSAPAASCLPPGTGPGPLTWLVGWILIVWPALPVLFISGTLVPPTRWPPAVPGSLDLVHPNHGHLLGFGECVNQAVEGPISLSVQGAWGSTGAFLWWWWWWWWWCSCSVVHSLCVCALLYLFCNCCIIEWIH